MAEPTIDFDLQRLEADLKRLEAEYNMYFSGRSARPPWETRSRVEALVKHCDRSHILNTGNRFRFETLQTRFSKLADLWDRALRAREEGREGPFAGKRHDVPVSHEPAKNRELYATTLHDPLHEMDRLEHLYMSLTEARRENGQEPVPFQRFTELVKGQVEKLRQSGISEVAFRVALKDGKVSFTARPLKGDKP